LEYFFPALFFEEKKKNDELAFFPLAPQAPQFFKTVIMLLHGSSPDCTAIEFFF